MRVSQDRRKSAFSGQQDAQDAARAQVRWPAWALFWTSVAWGSTVLVFVTFPILQSLSAGEQTGAVSKTPIDTVTVLWGAAILATNSLIAIGAMQMHRLRNRSLAYGGAILALIPLVSPCYIVGLPLGVWALIVLRRPEVARAFESTTAAERR